MAGVNKQILIGNLGADPEVRYTQGGTAVANLRVAVNERVKKGDNWVDHVEWFTVVVFGKTAENAGQHLSKGRQVYVEGKSRFKEYQKRDGGTGYAREIVAFNLTYLGNKNDGGGGGGGGGGGQRNGGEGAAVVDGGFYDDDLPF